MNDFISRFLIVWFPTLCNLVFLLGWVVAFWVLLNFTTTTIMKILARCDFLANFVWQFSAFLIWKHGKKKERIRKNDKSAED